MFRLFNIDRTTSLCVKNTPGKSGVWHARLLVRLLFLAFLRRAAASHPHRAGTVRRKLMGLERIVSSLARPVEVTRLDAAIAYRIYKTQKALGESSSGNVGT